MADKNNNKLSLNLKESIKTIKIPVITVDIDSKQYNLILDTGSDSSYMDYNIIDSINTKELVGKQECIISGTGTKDETIPIYKIGFKCCGYNFSDYFSVNDFSSSFDYIRETNHIQLHGILGCEFLDANKCIIDFKEKMFYI